MDHVEQLLEEVELRRVSAHAGADHDDVEDGSRQRRLDGRPQWVVLSALWCRYGLITGEFARYTGNALPATSRIIDRMVKNGLVRRRGDPADRHTVRMST